MNTSLIFRFLKDIAANNNREWFHAHKDTYDAVKADFERGVAAAIARIATFDDEIQHVVVKDTTYRFYRDTRFSPDKSPYKRHLGAYINARGKKALRGGYYIHLEPGNSMLAVGNYWLPTNILTACRNEIMANIDQWLRCVENADFQQNFLNGTTGFNPFLNDEQHGGNGFGLERLKKCPTGFPRDWEHVEWLRLKDYCAWHHVEDSFFEGDHWLDEMERVMASAKPMMDFVNSVIDDYE